MNKKLSAPDTLRTDAEAQLIRVFPAGVQARSTEELLHELHVYQIELEMQNDELRRTQLALEESRDRYVDLYEFAPVGYLTLSRNGMITEINLTGAALLGVERNKLMRRRLASLVASEDSDFWRRHFMRVLQNGEMQSCELVLKRDDGAVFQARLDCRHMKVGNISSVRVILSDISHKQIEQELRVMNDKLTHDVAKRTSDLSALTAHIQKLAENEKANLARELHDELGSTLAGISMEVGLLKGKISAPELLQNLSLIKDLLSNATQITRGVINQLYPTVLDNYGFVSAIEWQVNEYRKHSGIAVELVLPKEEVVMEQVFALAAYRITQECLTNIAKHAGASKVHIEAKASDGFLDLTIQDDGKGLCREINAERGDAGGINTGGHGIFGMIERARYLGGSMEIGSEDGKGTTARLCIPMAAAKPKNKKRVLVVDDHAIVRDALRQLLDSQTDDFSVEGEASDGKTAIQMAIEGVWDIMLLDISLPKKNGLKVLEEIMAVKPGLPIIMLSSHAHDEYGEVALAKGAVGYIEKGETAKLVDAMRRAILLH